jgi:large subunit ribosomal protein L10
MEIQEKREIVSALKEKLETSAGAIIADFHGMNVSSMQKLRREIKHKGLELMVVKNTLLAKAVEGSEYGETLKPFLKGMTAVAWSAEDPTAPAKVLKNYRKEDETLKIKCGFLEGKVLDAAGVEELARLPGKEELRAGFLAFMSATAQQFLALLEAPMTSLLMILQNYKDAKEG